MKDLALAPWTKPQPRSTEITQSEGWAWHSTADQEIWGGGWDVEEEQDVAMVSGYKVREAEERGGG